MITDDDIRNAWAAIARTDAGRVAYLHLQKIRMEVPPTSEPGALQSDRGRRMFAAELMGHMASEIAETVSGGRDAADADRQPNERPIVFAGRRPTDGSRHRSFREFAAEHDPELRDLKPNDG